MKIRPNPALPWPIDYDDGVVPIGDDEGCRLKAYRCIAGRWTCGWGETDGVTPSTVWTQEYADQRFCDSLTERANQVRDLCKIEPTSNQLSALVSLSYNIGMAGLASSTVMKCHNRGDFTAASRAFSLWNKFKNPKTGKLEVSSGLTARRARESALYLRADIAEHSMPQAVAAESSLSSSPIAQSGAVTAGAGVVTLVSQAGDQVGTVSSTVKTAKEFATDTLGLPAEWFLPLLLVLVGGVIVWQRSKQRGQGWA